MISKEEFRIKFENEFSKEKAIFIRAQIFAYVWVVVMTILVVGATVGLHYLVDRNNANAILFVIICIVAWFAIAILPLLSIKDRLVAGFKNFDLKKVLTMIYGNEIEYSKQRYINPDLFAKSGFCISKFNSYSGEDYFEAVVERQTPFGLSSTTLAASDVRVEKTFIDENGNTKHKKLFSGVFGAIQFKTPFNCALYLNGDKALNLQQLETESTEFNKIFAPKTNNQVNARLILSVTTMQTLLDFVSQAKCKIGFSFVDDYLFFTFGKNLFEPNKKNDKFTFELIEPIYDDLAILDKLINEIISNRKIFRV